MRAVHRHLLLYLVLLMLLPTILPAAELPEHFAVGSIRFLGMHHFKKKKLRSLTSIKPPAVWRFWVPDPAATQEDLSEDADRITALYRSAGYYHVKVGQTVDIMRRRRDGTVVVRVVYRIREGAPVTVDRISIKSADGPLPVSEVRLRKALPLKNGERFEEKFYQESKKLLENRMGAEGYPRAKVAGKALIYPATNRAEVTFTVTPGRLCFFGDTTVSGNKRIVRDQILNRARTYRTGERYDTRKVEQTQRNLYDLDVFKAALIRPGAPDAATGRVPMRLEVSPKKKRSVKLGVGYGDEDGIRLKGGLTFRNIGGWAGKLKLEGQRSDLVQKVSAGYDQPYFLDARSSLRTESGMLRETLAAYDSLKVFATSRFTHRLSDDKTLTAAYSLEYNELQNLNLVSAKEQAAFRANNTFFISALSFEMVRNTVGRDRNPSRGSIVTGSVEVASGLLASELTYIKPSLEVIKYVPLPFRTILACRVRFQAITDVEHNGNIPIFKRLFLGGANTVRGYAFQKLGPLDASGNPVGGLSSALANIELRRPIVGIFSVVVFLDMGMVEPEAFHYNTGDLRYSTGAGLRMATPVGPLRLDFGYKLNPPTYPAGSGISEKMDRWRIHLNIGQAF